jgi:hypothetical protein
MLQGKPFERALFLPSFAVRTREAIFLSLLLES